ncbi:phosphate regulon sensor histidine kinase PhoR [Rhodoferax sp.]|uniref:phosphate regulon sensor histidine kinase PhoR n=1 Tax=Rhodoferax sp. TaxID=50421 RepID=UPI0027562086|nr:phosphate regulon sensor histidine kinase PhoR [Rhodoferax sp.]
MVWRVFRFFLFQLGGGLIGYWSLALANPLHGLIIGLLVASALWVAIDLRRVAQLLTWLKEADQSRPLRLHGLWAEVAARASRLLRQQESRALNSERRLQEFLSAIQASPNGVVLLDALGRIEWCNETAADHFGFDPKRDMQQQIGNLVREPVFLAYQAAGDFTHDVQMPGPRSTASRPVRLAVHLHDYGEGRRLLLSRDVTALEQAEAMRRDFVANVSHEIRTPLTVLSGFIETLQTLPLAAAERECYLALMAQQAQRMQTLVNDLLTLSRLEGSPPPRADEWVSLQRLLAQCEQEGRALSTTVAAPGHAWCVVNTGPAELAGSYSELLSAAGNLISNAVRYTPASGLIEVAWRTLPDGQAELSVKDAGPGIAPEHLPRLTERFYRVDRSRSRDTGGTGLGLAIVKHVAQRHGAELRIDSVPGQGSRFAIVFPASRIRAESDALALRPTEARWA